MPNPRNFEIAFAGLKDGEHDFEFHVDSHFFEDYEQADFNRCEASVDVLLTKSANMLVLMFDLNGSVIFPCDRCLDDVLLPIEGRQRLIAKFGEESGEESEDVIVLSSKEHKISVKQYIYELISLSFPSKRVHAEGKCNADVINKLNELAIEDQSTADERWKALKNLNITSS